MYVLPQHLRESYGELLGTLIEQPTKAIIEDAVRGRTCVVCVGDVVSHTLFNCGIHFDIGIIDYKTCRGEFVHADELRGMDADRRKVSSGAGTISIEGFEAVKTAMNETFPRMRPLLIEVEGEEDLLFMPAVMFAPENSLLFYGQPNVGIVAVYPNEGLKLKMKGFLEMMEDK